MSTNITELRVPFMDLARHHKPLAHDLRAAFDRVLHASSFILGEEVERFEAEFAQFCGAKHCVGVASGTAALTIMLKAVGIGAGDEVIVPAHTFIATALSVLHAGALPVCADVDAGTGLLDPDAARAAITPATAAILPVHLYGQICPMDPLRELASSYGLALLEDAAQAHGANAGDRRAGSLGTAGAFSFYPSKNLGALGDGGAILTDDPALAAAARRLRDLGRDDDGRHELAGYNERLDGLQAAALRIKLPRLEEWNATRRALAQAYRERLPGELELLSHGPGQDCVYHLFPVRVKARDALAVQLRARGIASGVHYPLALPDQPPLAPLAGAECPVARAWAASELSLPLFPELREGELEAVCAALAELLDGG